MPLSAVTNAERARAIIDSGKLTLDSKLAVFTVMGTTEPRVVKLFPNTTCSCPAKSNCYHIKAAEMAIGLEKEQTKRPINLTQPRRNKRKHADKTSGRKRPRVDDIDVVPAGDVDQDEAANLINAIVRPTPAMSAAVAAPANHIDDDIENDNELCAICHLDFPPHSRAKKCNWVACDNCKTWFHNICVGLGKRQVESYKCVNC